jgi:hypothetical protein
MVDTFLGCSPFTEATNSLSARLKQTYGEDNVVLVTKNKEGVSSDEVSLFDVSFLLGSSGFNELSGSFFSSLSARLKQTYGEDNVVLVTKNKEGSFKIQGDINHYAAIFFVGCLIVWFD